MLYNVKYKNEIVLKDIYYNPIDFLQAEVLSCIVKALGNNDLSSLHLYPNI